MRPVSDKWAKALAGSHGLSTLVRVVGDTGDPVEVKPSAGSVTLDATADIRGRMDLSFSDPDLVPFASGDLLAPYGNEVEIYRGVKYSDGSVENVRIGIFGIEDSNISDQGTDLPIQVSGMDRSRKVQRAAFEDAYSVAKDTVISQAILSTVQAAWPDVPYDSALPTATSLKLPKIVAAAGDDRWAFVTGMAQAIGMVLYFDGDGLLTLKPYTPGNSVLDVTDGEGGSLVSVDRRWSREAAFNRVIATGENTENDTVYSGVATDNNPDSPTYYYGPFGRVPRFYNSPYITADVQAQDAASSILAQELGTTASVSFEMIPNPALEPGDSVLVRRERAGVNEVHVIDSITIGLSADSTVSCSTREQTVAA